MGKRIKWNKPFPYRTLNEIFTVEEVKKIFNSNMFFNDISFKKWNDMLAERFYMKYSKRYPHEQDKTFLSAYILQTVDTYIDTFYNNVMRYINIDNITLDNFKKGITEGNELVYGSISGISSTPYNNDFNKDLDNLWEKRQSETKQNTSQKDIIRRTQEIMSGKLTGEVINFIDSFYALFSQIDLSEYIEKELRTIISSYKNVLNDLIDCYNEVKPYIRKENK